MFTMFSNAPRLDTSQRICLSSTIYQRQIISPTRVADQAMLPLTWTRISTEESFSTRSSSFNGLSMKPTSRSSIRISTCKINQHYSKGQWRRQSLCSRSPRPPTPSEDATASTLRSAPAQKVALCPAEAEINILRVRLLNFFPFLSHLPGGNRSIGSRSKGNHILRITACNSHRLRTPVKHI